MVGDIDDASGTVATIEEAGGQARWQNCDVGVKEDVVALRDAVLTQFGAVNIVCSNVGIGVAGPLHSVSDEDFERTMRVNVTGSYVMLQTFAPALTQASGTGGPASLLFTGSEHSLGVPPTDRPPFVPVGSVYTMSKFAMLGIAGVARRDLEAAGVHVAILCPGWTATDMLHSLGETDEHFQMVLRRFGQEPSLVAEMAFDGLQRRQHIIPTNPFSREFVVDAHREIIEAMEAAALR
jgi:NAD(P)-dependent dehydrogenase (short-subunit alcohol dehydrogenase family)